jgi:hypothetical protein
MASLAGAGGSVAKIPNPFSSLPPAQAVNLVTEPRDLISGQLTSLVNTQLYSFQLQKGEFLQANIQTPTGSSMGSLMTILSSDGTILKTIGASADPSTGLMTSNPAYGFSAPASGTYYVQVAGNTAASVHTGAYTLELHRLALAQGPQSVAVLAQTGSLYAWLDGTTLDISGPTGYGFGITGNWTRKTTVGANSLIGSTYTATGVVQLQTAAGPVDLTLGAGTTFTVTTAAQVNGQLFGVVSAISASATVATGDLTSSFSVFGFDLSPLSTNATISMKLGGVAGIGLGNSAVVQATGAPVNNAVPYLYFTINPAGMSNVLSVACDPADPALFVEGAVLGAIPLGPVSVSGLGLSKQGQIPYTPVDAPSQYTNSMSSGHLVLQGSFDTTALTVIPSQIAGDITMNLDPNHTGKVFGGASVSAAEVAGIFALLGTGGGAAFLGVLSQTDSPLAQNFDEVYRNLGVGINGTLNINPLASFQKDFSWWIGNEILGLPTGPNSFVDQVLNWANGKIGDPQNLALLAIGHGSMIYDGPTESLYFRGGTTNPFANTPLAKLTPVYTIGTFTGVIPTVDLDAAVKPGGEFYLSVSGTYNIAGLPDRGQVVIAHNYPVTGPASKILGASGPIGMGISKTVASQTTPLVTGIYLDANVKVLGNYVDLQGKMLNNGDFTIQGTAVVHVGSLSGSAFFTLSDTAAHGVQFTGGMDASFSSDYIRGDINASFTFGIANGSVTYAGSVHASGQVYIPYVGWEGADLSGGMSNGDIWVSVDGYRVDFRF